MTPPAATRTATPTADAAPGMGALPLHPGFAFRVWAPHATAVHVTGSFNDWSEDASPLLPEADGYWYGEHRGAAVGDEYRFVIDGPAGRLWRVDPYAAAVTNSIGNGILTDLGAAPDDGFQTPAWSDMVIYEMHLGTFHAPEGDGNFITAAQRLQHLADLGVNAVQIMPAAEFAGDTSWGYNPAHIFAVESAYGGPEGLRHFVAEAHKAGIAVILDVVYNHFGPSDLDLWQFDGWSENGKGGIYFYNDWRSATPWGDTRPDYGRDAVRQFIRDNALFWLRSYGLDGLRFDMTLYVRNASGNEGDPGHELPDGWSLMQWVNRDIAADFPGKITIAEDLRLLGAMTAPVEDGGAGFGAQWDAGFVHPVRAVLTAAEDDARDLPALIAALTGGGADPFQRVIYTESHDEVANGKARIPHEIGGDRQDHWHAQKRSTLGAAMVLTSAGIPMLFQGQEFLQGDWFDDTVPLDWARRDSFRGIVRLYRDLIALRRNRDGHSAGLSGRQTEVLLADDDRKLLVIRRFHDDGDPGVIVALNLRTEAAHDIDIPLPHAGAWRLALNTDWAGYSADFDDFHSADLHVEDSAPLRGRFAIGPYSALVYVAD